MILSFEHHFVFIKGRKVAGTSVEIALSELCGPADIVTPITPADERLRFAARNYSDTPDRERGWLDALREGELRKPPRKIRFWNHMSLTQVAARIDLTDFTVLAVERSPYAKVLSLVNWRRQARTYEGEVMTSSREDIAAAFDPAIVIDARNIDLYRWPDDTLATQPWRFERIAEEIGALADRLDRPRPALPHTKRGMDFEALDALDCFTDEQLDIVEREFAAEFDAFDYPRLDRTLR